MTNAPPHNKEAEKALLSCMMNYPDEDYSQVNGDDIYTASYGLITKCILELKSSNEDINLLSIYEKVKVNGITIPQITELSEYDKGTRASIPSLISTIKDYRRRRLQIEVAREMEELSTGTPEEIISYAEKLKEIAKIGTSDKSSMCFEDVNNAYELIQERMGKKVYGYSWGSHFEFLDNATKGLIKKMVYRIGAPSGVGKAMPLYEKVLTPNGFVEIGSLKIGDRVNNSYGSVSNVTGVFPQGVKPIYRMKFSDGTFVDSCENHLWAVHNNDWNSKDYKIMEVKDIIKSGVKRNKGGYKFSIPNTDKVFFDGLGELEIDPYVMGIILSEGNLGKSHIQITNTCPDVKERVSSLLKYGDELSIYNSSDITYGIVGGNTLSKIRGYGLDLHRSYEKFIPKEYLYSTPTDRKELLEGLIDGDGCVDDSSYVYTTVSKELAEGVQFLAQSLGGLTKMNSYIKKFTYKGIKKTGRLSYNVRISLPFKLNLSVDYKNNIKDRGISLRKSIVDIEYLGELECVCISVSAKNHLYITSGFAVTHNTQFIYTLIPELLKQTNPDGSKVKVAFFTLENTKESTLTSIMCKAQGINQFKLTEGLVEGNWQYLVDLGDQLHIIDNLYEVSDIFSKIMQIRPDIVILDYIGYVNINGITDEGKYTEYAKRVVRFAKEENLCWIDLSNLANDTQTNDEIRIKPKFYGSSFLVNNSDVNIMIMRNEVYSNARNYVYKNKTLFRPEDIKYFASRDIVDMVVTKNRWGPPRLETTYGVNQDNGGNHRELPQADLDALRVKYGG